MWPSGTHWQAFEGWEEIGVRALFCQLFNAVQHRPLLLCEGLSPPHTTHTTPHHLCVWICFLQYFFFSRTCGLKAPHYGNSGRHHCPFPYTQPYSCQISIWLCFLFPAWDLTLKTISEDTTVSQDWDPYWAKCPIFPLVLSSLGHLVCLEFSVFRLSNISNLPPALTGMILFLLLFRKISLNLWV